LSFEIDDDSNQNYGRDQFENKFSVEALMKKILSVLMLSLAVFIIAFCRPAIAADTANGAKVFSANCAACHMGGRNVVAAGKTLKQDALEKYSMNSLEAIVNQVKNGKNAMPAFKNRLNDQQIEDVAAYVLEQAEKDWS
jgi:cytochrome c6